MKMAASDKSTSKNEEIKTKKKISPPLFVSFFALQSHVFQLKTTLGCEVSISKNLDFLTHPSPFKKSLLFSVIMYRLCFLFFVSFVPARKFLGISVK